MTETIQRIDEESERALALLARAEIQTLLSESCDINARSSLLEVVSVSIQIDKRRFIVITSDWSDTPKEALDYHLLSVRLDQVPRGIYYNPSPPKNRGNYKCDHLSIRLGAMTPVAKVEVLEASEDGDTESVVYDAGIVVTLRDGLQVAIVRANSIIGALQIAHTPSDIQAATDGLVVRTAYVA
jgi:hypothetical protein